PDVQLQFRNRVGRLKLRPPSAYPHGLSHADFDSLVTNNKPISFNLHGYAALIHKLSYRRLNHQSMHIHGYKEKGNINTPLGLLIKNQVDRFSLANPGLEVGGDIAAVRAVWRRVRLETIVVIQTAQDCRRRHERTRLPSTT